MPPDPQTRRDPGSWGTGASSETSLGRALVTENHNRTLRQVPGIRRQLEVVLPDPIPLEQELIAHAIFAREAAARFLVLLDPGDFWSPATLRVLRAAADRYTAGQGTTLDEDIQAIAHAADVEPAVLATWAATPRRTYADSTNMVVLAIIEQAIIRERLAAVLGELDELGVLEEAA